ncbi:uncharacterized protein [Phyllobates terribilis]|uniref:uncharacterized protein n=1 Tax=Phyllobates terribilis TaxID=111132 RepID=UPI003CCA77C1
MSEAGNASQFTEAVEESERNSNYSQLDKDPLCEADWQSLLFDPIASIDFQSDVLECCTLVSDFCQREQHKEFLHPGENPAGPSHDHSINNIGNIELPNYDPKDILEQPSQEITKQTILDHAEVLPDDTSKSDKCQYQVVLALKSSVKSDAKSNKKNSAKLKSSTLSGNRTCRRSGTTKVKSEYTLRSASGGRRSAKSGIQEKIAVSEPDDNVGNSDDGRKRGRRKEHQNRKLHDEFSKMKVHLRYLLHRMKYEQNLIDAYSSEGWRGQSLEKLRPEKEIQRAKMDINRSKLKIRGLFQRIDAVCAEGRFPVSLFDSEGLIDCEDIFCAKCGSKDLSRDNDIILCDGPCDRGFHQLCLDPPLRTEDIPPGDEGWFCPACVCKFDCIKLLNDSVGTKVSNTDSWEHVFPEALKTESTSHDPSGLPSEDSEDDDYNPNGVGDDQDHDDESDFSSASEDLEAPQKQNYEEQYPGLPSDDSEDDDYNPNFTHTKEQSKHESSSSDFTSASEDLHAFPTNDEVSSKDEPQMSPSRVVQELDDSMPVSSRREVERLDYKKLHDEAYGNSCTDSSEDEDWKDALTPKRRKNGRAVTPKRRRYGTTNDSSLKPCNDSRVDATNIPETSKTSSGGKKQPFKRLGEAVTQGLYASFKENQYPDRSTKEKLAAELSISVKQVNKWFGNARWSFNHPSSAQDASTSRAVSKEIDRDDGTLKQHYQNSITEVCINATEQIREPTFAIKLDSIILMTLQCVPSPIFTIPTYKSKSKTICFLKHKLIRKSNRAAKIS